MQEIPESLLAHNQDKQELEIPAPNDITTTPLTIDKQSDTGDITESSPTLLLIGISAETTGEGNREIEERA